MRLYDLHAIPFTVPAGGMVSVENAAALAAYDDTEVSDGSLAYVQTYRDYFQKVPGPVPALTDTTIPTDSGDGGWYRLGIASPTWLGTADWYIDGVSGNDEGSGSITEPLLTHDEFMRRLGSNPLAQSLTAHFVDAFTGDFSHVMSPGQQRGYSVLYKGPDLSARARRRPIYTETFATFTEISRLGTGERTNFLSVLDGATWATYIGKIVLVTEAADPAVVGAYAIVQGVTAGDDTTVYTTPFTKAAPGNPDATVVNPADGDTYVVVDMLVADFDSFLVSTSERLSTVGESSVQFQNLSFGLPRSALVSNGTADFFSCTYDGGFTVGGTGDVTNWSCMLTSDTSVTDAGNLTLSATFLNGDSGSLLNLTVDSPDAHLTVDNDSILSGSDALIIVDQRNLTLSNFGAFDTANDIVTLSLGAEAVVDGYVYGDSNTEHFFVMGTSTRVITTNIGLLADTTAENVSFGDVIVQNWGGLPFIANVAVTDSQAAWLNSV